VHLEVLTLGFDSFVAFEALAAVGSVMGSDIFDVFGSTIGSAVSSLDIEPVETVEAFESIVKSVVSSSDKEFESSLEIDSRVESESFTLELSVFSSESSAKTGSSEEFCAESISPRLD